MPRVMKNKPDRFEVVEKSAESWGCYDRLLWCEADSGRVFVNGIQLSASQLGKLITWLEATHRKMPGFKED